MIPICLVGGASDDERDLGSGKSIGAELALHCGASSAQLRERSLSPDVNDLILSPCLLSDFRPTRSLEGGDPRAQLEFFTERFVTIGAARPPLCKPPRLTPRKLQTSK